MATSVLTNALPIKLFSFSIAATTGTNMTMPNGQRHFFIVSGSSNNQSTMYIIRSTSRGGVSVTEIGSAGTNLNLTASTNNVLFKTVSGNGTALKILDVVLQGNFISE